MLNYYYQIAPYMLPYMTNRPQTLNRFPNGIYGQSFYQKDVTGKVPSWIKTHKYFSEGDQRQKNFLVCTDEASLLYIASLGCIEMNPWSSTTQTPDHPDWCIIDLDPDKKNTFDQVIEAAQVTHQLLDAIGVVQLIVKAQDPQGCIFIFHWAQNTPTKILKNLHEQSLQEFRPCFRISLRSNVKYRIARGKCIWIFFRIDLRLQLQHLILYGQNLVLRYPCRWPGSEVKKGLKILDFNIRNAIPRVKEHGDLFKGVLGKRNEHHQGAKEAI